MVLRVKVDEAAEGQGVRFRKDFLGEQAAIRTRETGRRSQIVGLEEADPAQQQ